MLWAELFSFLLMQNTRPDQTIPTVCKTVKDAETRAADKCVEDSIYIARCVKELYTGLRGDAQLKVDICTDSQSLVD